MRYFSISGRWIAILGGVCLLAVVIVATLVTWRELHRARVLAEKRTKYEADIQRQLEKYPLISIAGRLEYERDRQGPAANNTRFAQPISLSTIVEDNLRDLERRPHLEERIQRDTYLREIHEGTYQKFVETPGMGVSRMPANSFRTPGKLDPDIEPIPLASGEYDPDRPLPEHFTNLPEHSFQRPDTAVQRRLHHDGVQQFLDRNWIGYVRDRDHVAGFVSHGFYQPKWHVTSLSASQNWEITRLELVSLLKHENPVAYVSEYLPRMDQLAEAETRPLNEFEQAALVQLRTEEDLVTDEGENHIRMLGAIRAGTSCLECHNVQRGELLGAFSYELRQHVN